MGAAFDDLARLEAVLPVAGVPARLEVRVADDEVLLRSLLLGESLSESDLAESLRELDQGIANAKSGRTRPAKQALGEIATELGIQIDR